MASRRTITAWSALAAVAAGVMMQPAPALAQFVQRPIPPLPHSLNAPSCPPGRVCQTRSPQFGLRCQTEVLWCGLQQPAPLGVSCFCNTPRGAVAGRVTQ
jgi:hypothetical protein